MLIGLGVRDVVLIERAGPGLRAGPDRADRRDRRPASRSSSTRWAWPWARAPTPAWCAAAPPRPRPPRSSRRPPTMPVWADPRGEGPRLRAGRGPGAAPHSSRADGRSRAFVNDQPASVGGAARAGRAAARGARPARDRRPAGRRAPTARCSTPSAASPPKPAACAEAWSRWRAARESAAGPERQPPAARPRKPRSSTLRLAELDRLDPREGEETALAERARAAGRRRKDPGRHRRRAATASAAARSPSGWARRCGRWSGPGSARSPGRRRRREPRLAADRRGGRGRGARARPSSPRRSRPSTPPPRAFDFEPDRLEKAEERLFALRAMARKLGVAGRRRCRPRASTLRRAAAARSRRRRGDALRRRGRRRRGPRRLSAAAAQALSRRPPRRRRPARRGGRGRAGAAASWTRRASASPSSRWPRTAPARPGADRVAVRDRHQSRRAVRRRWAPSPRAASWPASPWR